MSPQEYSDRFDADFLATAKTIKPGGGLNIETVRFALGSQPKHKVLPFDERCERIFSVFSFLHKNVAELERLHLLYLENGHAVMKDGLNSALRIFFGSGDFLLPKEPRLDLFITVAQEEQKRLKP
jgi:hypothetical protein